MFKKGQNYRIFINGAVVAEETSCTVTKGVDTEDAMNKDLAPDSSSGELMGSQPVAMYKNMTFQVEAQGAGAKALFTRALALMDEDGGAVGWAETSGSSTEGQHNRTPAASVTYVKAICNDLTINAPNRQPVTCTAQFTVIPGTPSAGSDTAAAATIPTLRGEFLRLFLVNGSTKTAIAAATNCSLHLSLSMEDAMNKDDTSSTTLGYKSQAPTQINYDLSSDCLYDGGTVVGRGGLANLTEGNEYNWELADASGLQQRTAGDVLASGKAMLTSLSTNAPVGQNITYSGSFTGIGIIDQLVPSESNGTD